MSKFAVIQMCSSIAVGMNLLAVRRQVSEAAEKGAKIVALPDHFALYSKNENDYEIHKEILGEGRIQNFLQKLSVESGVWLIASGVPIISEYENHSFYLATIIYNDIGQLVDVYYHLSSQPPAAFADAHICFESQVYGEQAKVIKTPYANLGLASGFDLYSPELFRYLKQQGADIFVVSMAMDSDLGAASWSFMLKARALENNTAVLAANQSGFHEDTGILSYGNSSIILADGRVAQSIEIGEGVLVEAIASSTFHNTDADQGIFQLKYRR
ncbi:nitrilase-related carbon-nitrogen hydrolase [Facilibium subflavum]|uniref:nitrilase-related carbon-nitrogen hydrolase n=1 Tax=Facilibium subflavum TaxID=2219058 RepID=UPI000E65342D|nr:nitrilase-related carbon-nitrogen hydrolase [Facilibium subflavum]